MCAAAQKVAEKVEEKRVEKSLENGEKGEKGEKVEKGGVLKAVGKMLKKVVQGDSKISGKEKGIEKNNAEKVNRKSSSPVPLPLPVPSNNSNNNNNNINNINNVDINIVRENDRKAIREIQRLEFENFKMAKRVAIGIMGDNTEVRIIIVMCYYFMNLI